MSLVTTRVGAATAIVTLAVAMLAAQGRGAGQAPAPPPRVAALVDLTGYWVSIVSEDWRYRQFTPPNGDYASVPLNANGRKAADAWDPARDEAAGEQCKAYGAAGLMRIPTRLHITWQDDNTLKMRLISGTKPAYSPMPDQKPVVAGGACRRRHGIIRARCSPDAAALRRLAAPRVTTTQMRQSACDATAYRRANTVMTEYFNRFDIPGGDSYLVVTSEIVDPENLATPFWTSQNFKRQRDATGWNPQPCGSR